MDDIDKSTANLVQLHFHGTGIFLLQLLDYESQYEVLECANLVDAAYELNKSAPLPAEYT